MGLTPIALTDADDDDLPWWQREVSFSRQPIRTEDLQTFLFQLSHMLRARLALLPTIEMIAARSESRGIRRILTETAAHLKNG
ncbi:MAG: hypothetical protein OIF48_05085 [Silicimonas sp.]|nr:hypothetical protein [Silicimonas sp.]